MNAHTFSMKPALEAIQQAPAAPVPPFRWTGDDLGLGNHGAPSIGFVDAAGHRWLTHSVEQILLTIDHFPDERDRNRLLAAAADHYGFDNPWALIYGRATEEPLWNVLDDADRILLSGVTHHAGWLAMEQRRKAPGWSGGFRFVRQRDEVQQ